MDGNAHNPTWIKLPYLQSYFVISFTFFFSFVCFFFSVSVLQERENGQKKAVSIIDFILAFLIHFVVDRNEVFLARHV